MPFLTTCCCGFSVRTGTKAIAVLSLVSINTIILLWMDQENDYLDRQDDEDDFDQQDPYDQLGVDQEENV